MFLLSRVFLEMTRRQQGLDTCLMLTLTIDHPLFSLEECSDGSGQPQPTASAPSLGWPGESWPRSREKIPPRLQNAKTGSTSYARGELYISEYNRHYTLQYNLQSTPQLRGRTE